MLTDVQREATESDIVFTVSKLCKYVSTQYVTLAKLLREKRTPLSLSLPQREDKKNESTRPTTQSIGPVPLLLYKSQVMLHNKAGGEKDMERRAPSPSFAHSELFREKLWAQHVLLLMPQ